ncbi:MAG: YwbE family protein [Bacilli bacterium]|nr:YwbE family protein [Bacilli bacterium]
MSIPTRQDIKISSSVSIVLKQDQKSGKLTKGIVQKILTSSNIHPHGIKVMLENGNVGRVQKLE